MGILDENEVNIAKNLIFSILIVIISGLMNTIYPLLIGILNSPVLFGNFSVLISWIMILSIPIVNGIAPAITKYISANDIRKANEYEGIGLFISLFYFLATSILISIFGLLFFSLKFLDLVIILFVLLVNIIHYVFRKSLQGQERFSYLFKLELISFMITIPFIVISWFFSSRIHEDYVIYLLLLPILLFNFIFAIIFVFNKGKTIKYWIIRKKPAYLSKFLLYALFVGTGSVLTLGLRQLQIILSGKYSTEYEVGILAFWSSATAIVTLFHVAIGSLILPRVTNLRRNNVEESIRYVKKINWILVLILFPLTCLLLILLGSNASYLDSISNSKYQMMLYWPVAVLMLLNSINNALTIGTVSYFSSSNKMVIFNAVNSFVYLISVIITWILSVPNMGIIGFALGLAIGSTLQYVTIQLVALIISKKKIGKQLIFHIGLAILLLFNLLYLDEINSIISIVLWVFITLPSFIIGVKISINLIKNKNFSRKYV